jgi:hypothetical protein
MIRGCGNVAIAVVFASLLDRYLYDGRHTEAALAMLRQIQHAFGF